MRHEDDYAVIDAMAQLGGSFVAALAVAFRRADPINFERLKCAFPEYWEEYRKLAARVDG